MRKKAGNDIGKDAIESLCPPPSLRGVLPFGKGDEAISARFPVILEHFALLCHSEPFTTVILSEAKNLDPSIRSG
jgi:hypothetical protein